LTPTQLILTERLGWGEFVPGNIVMGNAYPTSGDRNYRFGPSTGSGVENEGTASGVSAAMESLIEENVRLRALVVQLSDLVLKNVVAQK
jgi:hypothetical protein